MNGSNYNNSVDGGGGGAVQKSDAMAADDMISVLSSDVYRRACTAIIT